MTGGRAPWYEEAFRASYRAVYPHRNLHAARHEVAHLLQRGLAGRVLDAGCGFGRHAVAMAEAALDPVGLDLSEELLLQGPAEDGGDRLRGRLVRGDLRRLPFGDGSFDGVVLLFSSFGYFDDRENEAVMGEMARVLRPGGLAFMDLMNPERIRSTLVQRSKRREGAWTIQESRSLSPDRLRVRKEVRLRDVEGTERCWREDVRLYAPDEINALAAGVGLEVVGTDGDFGGACFGPGAERQIVRLRA